MRELPAGARTTEITQGTEDGSVMSSEHSAPFPREMSMHVSLVYNHCQSFLVWPMPKFHSYDQCPIVWPMSKFPYYHKCTSFPLLLNRYPNFIRIISVRVFHVFMINAQVFLVWSASKFPRYNQCSSFPRMINVKVSLIWWIIMFHMCDVVCIKY